MTAEKVNTHSQTESARKCSTCAHWAVAGDAMGQRWGWGHCTHGKHFEYTSPGATCLYQPVRWTPR